MRYSFEETLIPEEIAFQSRYRATAMEGMADMGDPDERLEPDHDGDGRFRRFECATLMFAGFLRKFSDRLGDGASGSSPDSICMSDARRPATRWSPEQWRDGQCTRVHLGDNFGKDRPMILGMMASRVASSPSFSARGRHFLRKMCSRSWVAVGEEWKLH